MKLVFPLLLTLGLVACATAEPETTAGATKTHYTLKLGDKMPSHAPLPTRTNIEVTWHYSNGATEVMSGYRGWDFDGDDRFEMVEVLSKDGVVVGRVFDFNGDGHIDLTK